MLATFYFFLELLCIDNGLVIRNLLCVALALAAMNTVAAEGWYSLLLAAACAIVLALPYLWVEQAIANNHYMNEDV